MGEKNLLTVKEFAQEIDVSVQTVFNYIESGKLVPAKSELGRNYFKEEQIPSAIYLKSRGSNVESAVAFCFGHSEEQCQKMADLADAFFKENGKVKVDDFSGYLANLMERYREEYCSEDKVIELADKEAKKVYQKKVLEVATRINVAEMQRGVISEGKAKTLDGIIAQKQRVLAQKYLWDKHSDMPLEYQKIYNSVKKSQLVRGAICLVEKELRQGYYSIQPVVITDEAGYIEEVLTKILRKEYKQNLIMGYAKLPNNMQKVFRSLESVGFVSLYKE